MFSWELGRQLKSLSVNGKTYSYKYNPDNLRTQKTDGTTATDFYWVDGQLTYQTDGTNDIYFLYDDNSSPIGFVLNETTYYYVKNLQGDIIAILDGNGALMVEYTYDAWGKLLNTVDNSGINLGIINPLRYRGYYYDQETGLYYLQSRYYDPTVGRFINADDYSFLGATGTVLSHNLFAYCENNPVNYSDNSGFFSIQRWIVADVLDFVLDWFLPVLNPINKLADQFTGALFKQKAFNPIKKAIRKLADGSFKLLNSIKNIVRKIPFVGRRLAKKINPEKFRRQIIGYMESKVFNAFLDTIIGNISDFTSIGGWVSIALDYFTDGSLNKKIKLW